MRINCRRIIQVILLLTCGHLINLLLATVGEFFANSDTYSARHDKLALRRAGYGVGEDRVMERQVRSPRSVAETGRESDAGMSPSPRTDGVKGEDTVEMWEKAGLAKKLVKFFKKPPDKVNYDKQKIVNTNSDISNYNPEIHSNSVQDLVHSKTASTSSPKLTEINSNSSRVPRTTELQDIFISVKTTEKYHKERLSLILDTWFQFAQYITYIFTDADDPEFQKQARGHLINTNCSNTHSRQSLCCKMSVEFDHFIASGKRWFCHVDDDTYVNVPALLAFLQGYNHTRDWYLGKPSISHPIEATHPDNPQMRVAFRFATGGAGFCLSRGLALKMVPYAGGGRLQTVCGKIHLPDDCSMGFIVYTYLQRELTKVKEFHSHLESLTFIKPIHLSKQLTFSYAFYKNGRRDNVVSVPGFYDQKTDPSRFRSIHCQLFSYLPSCSNITQTRQT